MSCSYQYERVNTQCQCQYGNPYHICSQKGTIFPLPLNRLPTYEFAYPVQKITYSPTQYIRLSIFLPITFWPILLVT